MEVANPARGQLNRENNIPLSSCVPEDLVPRDGFSRPVPRQPAHLILPLSNDVVGELAYLKFKALFDSFQAV